MDMSLDQLIAGWRAAREMNVDVGIAHGPWGSTVFLESVGMGLFTETMFQLDNPRNNDLDHLHKTEEKLTATLEILHKRVQSYAAKTIEVRLDGHDLTDAYVLLEAMNMRSIGPNLGLAPDADLGDGRLDIVLVPEREQEKLQRYLSACGEGRSDVPGLTVHKGRHLQIKWEGGMMHIDDDVWPDNDTHRAPCPTMIDVQVHVEALRFLMPAWAKDQAADRATSGAARAWKDKG
jgi:diacylglycerol kinase family enzyme